jgi:protein tyrosine/serine phosphatase
MRMNNREPEDAEEATERYLRAIHAMQTGVAYMQEYDQSEKDIKHIRVGVNSALVSGAALAQLLIEKGVITREEYHTAQADAMEEEVARYEKMLEEKLGVKITLL